MPFYIRIYLYSFLIAPFYSYLIVTNLQLVPYYVLGSLAIILLLVFYFERPKKIKFPKYLIPLLLFTIYYSIWDFYNGRFQEFGLIKLIFKNYPLHTLAILLIIENSKFDRKFIYNLIRGFKVLVILSLVFTLIQLFVNPLFYTTKEASAISLSVFSYQVRNTAIWAYLSPLDVGLSFLPILAILIGYYYYRKDYFPLSLFFMAGAIVAFLTNARWTQLNLVVLLFPLLFGLKKSRIKTILVTTFSVFLIAMLLSNFFNYLGFGFTEYLETRILSPTSQSRFLAFDLFEEFFPQEPILGTGVRVDEDLERVIAGRTSQIHVGYLSSLYEFGIVGSLFLFTFWFLIVKNLFQNYKIHGNIYLLFGFLCFLLANLTLVKYSIFYIGLLFVLIFDKYFTTVAKERVENINNLQT